MAHRSVPLYLITFVCLLVTLAAGSVYMNQSLLLDSLTIVPSSLRWLTLVVLVVVSQVLVGYLIWKLLHRPQQTVRTEALHSIIHEFQTPIAAIRMAADILDSPIGRNQPNRTEKYVRIIREETERLQHHVETMLTLAQADHNTLTLNREPVLVHQLLHSVAERYGDFLNLRLSGPELTLMADRLHLTNVLYNLLDNAVKYSVGEPAITVCAETSSNGLAISVCDQGVGIPTHLLPQIFQPFFRVHDRNQPNVKGFGLGLSYVQRIIQAHKWTIEVKSELGRGSEFMIRIPQTAFLPAQPGVSIHKQAA